MRFAIFPVHLSKVPLLPTKKWCQVIRSAAPVTQNHLSKPEDLMLQNSLRKSAPWPPNISDEHVFCTAPATRNASLKIFKCPTPAIAFGNATKPSRFAQVWQGAQSLAPATRKHIWTSKSAPYPSVFLHFWLQNVLRATTARKGARACGVLCILASKCASRHNGMHFFDISTSKSGPTLVCFVHFDFEMCFAPQRRALFQHLNFQKWSEPGVFCTFWLANVLRATTACNFSSLIWPDGSAPAAVASLLFDPPEPQIIGIKTQCFAAFLPFCASASSFFWPFSFFDFLSSSPLFSDASILSEVWLLNFLRWTYVYMSIHVYACLCKCHYIYIYMYVISHAPKTRHMTLEVQVRATLVARSSGAPSPTENSGSESPVEKGSVGGVFWNYRLVMTYGLWTSPFFFQLKFRKSSFWSSGPFFIVNPGWLRIIGWASSESCCCSFFKRIIGKIRWWPWKLPRERERWFVLDPAGFSLEHDDFHWTMFDYPKRHRQVGLQSTV